jgi:hypothetical protein
MTRLRLSAGRLAAALAVTLALAATLTRSGPAGAAAVPCEAWTGVPPPSPGATANHLLGTAVLSPCDAWVVGQSVGGGVTSTLTEHWDGATWTVVPSPSPGNGASVRLESVRADATGDVWAVGSFFDGVETFTLILRWTGTAWTQVPSPSPGTANFLQAVKPVSANNAWAVGTYASGGAFKTLVVHWNGTTWTQITSPNPGPTNELESVAATSATNAWAVGLSSTPTADQTLILHWDGATWTQVPSPNPNSSDDLFGVGATSVTNAWAVGNTLQGGVDQTLILRWNGTAWAQVPSPSPGGTGMSSDLSGVVATSASNAWAVGSYRVPVNAKVALALHWDGSTWVQVPTPNPSGTLDQLSAVGASSASNVWAVGSYESSPTSQLAFAIHCC